MSAGKNGKAKYRTGTLYKRGKAGNYYLRYYAGGKQTNQRLTDADGKSITDRRLAEKAARDLLAPLQHEAKEDQLKAIAAKVQDEHQKRADALKAQKPPLKLSKIWVTYYASGNRPKSGEATLNRYRAVIKAFNKWMGENYPSITCMHDVGMEHAEAYAEKLEADQLSPSSFNIYLNNLSTVWATLAKKASLEANPFAWDKATRSGIQRKNIKAETTARKKRALTLDEVNSVIGKATGDYRSLLILLACTGQRLVDCVKLQWKSIDLEGGIIQLTPQKTAKRTGTEVLIPILPQLRAELKSKSQYDRYVLPEIVAAYDRDPSTITKQIRGIFKTAEIQIHKESRTSKKAVVAVGAHSFRHSFVSIARLAGVPDAIIQTITGHESVEMVDHYTAITPDAVKALSAGFGKTIGKKPTTPAERASELLRTATADNWQKIIDDALGVLEGV
jgi:integrase